ncbi:hypothetical protein ACP70R_031020 [Stipagrostis hirtigluma subsp. patula]
MEHTKQEEIESFMERMKQGEIQGPTPISMGDARFVHPSMHPPTDGDADLVDGTRPGWVLLDFSAYIPERPCRNATTASCKTGHGKEIQVTFFPAHPPRLSYFCVHCPGAPPSIFSTEPKIVAADGKFVLLHVAFGDYYAFFSSTLQEFYMYCADGGPDGGASLELLPRPDLSSLRHQQIGLIARGDEYTIAALLDDACCHRPSQQGLYDVCLLNSKTKVWTKTPAIVPRELVQQYSDFEEGFFHLTAKVIAIGGESGTMAFVDLWRGILLYDVFVHDDYPVLRYVALPHQLHNGTRPNIGPWVSRDIALIEGHIKLVEILIDSRPDKLYLPIYPSDGWVAKTWSRMATFPEGDSWIPNGKLEASDIVDENSSLHLDLRQRLLDDEGKPCLSLEQLRIGHPTLSLDEDDVVCFMIQAGRTKPWVIALDIGQKMIKGGAELRSKRIRGISFTYTPSRISKYLNTVPGTKDDLKRLGMPLSGACSKKPFGISNVGSVEAENDGSML